MKELNLDKVACPHCGTSGEDYLTFTEQSETEGRIECPDCGSFVEFTKSDEEDVEITDFKGPVEIKWWSQVHSAFEDVE